MCCQFDDREKEELKLLKSGIKVGILLPANFGEIKRIKENPMNMNSHMPTTWITQMKWTKIPRNTQTTKTDSRRNEIFKQNYNKQIESINNQKLLSKKSSGPVVFTAEFYQIFKEEITPLFFKLFLKLEHFQTHSTMSV